MTVHQLFMYFKEAHDSVKMEVLYMKLVWLIKICLNKTYCNVFGCY
jgi:hypothetical protein